MKSEGNKYVKLAKLDGEFMGKTRSTSHKQFNLRHH